LPISGYHLLLTHIILKETTDNAAAAEIKLNPVTIKVWTGRCKINANKICL